MEYKFVFIPIVYMVGDGECRSSLAARFLDSVTGLGDPGFTGVGTDRCLSGLAGSAGGGYHHGC